MINQYAHEKIRELEAGLARPALQPAPSRHHVSRRPLARPIGLLGRALRRTGAGIETWAHGTPTKAS